MLRVCLVQLSKPLCRGPFFFGNESVAQVVRALDLACPAIGCRIELGVVSSSPSRGLLKSVDSDIKPYPNQPCFSGCFSYKLK